MDTHLGLVDKGSLEAIVYKKMGLLLGSLWFWITKSLMFLVTCIARLVFRTKREDSSPRVGSNSSEKKESRTLDEVLEESVVKDRNYEAKEERETSGFSFKFEHQIPNYNLKRDEEAEVSAMKVNPSSTKANISNYRFVSEKDVSGFMEEPEAKTFRIHESFVHSSTDETSSEEKPDAQFESRFLSVNDFQQPSTEALIQKVGRNSDANAFKALNKPEGVIVFRKHPIDKGKLKSFDTNLLGEKEGKILSSEFSSLDSDSESSVSDGYSVKDLKADSDSDGFLSERDFDEHEHESYTRGTSSNRYSIEFLQGIPKFEATLLQSLGNSDVVSADSVGRSSSIKNRIDYDGMSKGFNHFDVEVSSRLEDEKSEQAIGNFSHLEEGWSDDESCKAEYVMKQLVRRELEKIELQKFNEIRSPTSSTYDIESMDDGDDGLFSLKNESFNSNSSDEVSTVKDLSEPESTLKDLDQQFSGKFIDIQNLEASIKHLEATLPERDSDEPLLKPEVLIDKKKETEKDLEQSKETHPKDLDDEELDELESLWEHQDLIEQLKMELRKVRAIGLPTILEESETPKTMDDLKPWKIDEKFLHEDPMDELHKFYKSYRERMRKFDILNYQKMYAMGFLQLKDPILSLTSQKTPKLTSLLSQNLWRCRRRKSSTDPSERFIKELQSDLETVYVGQMCLSWEFLRWQYEKAQELPETDPYRSHQYNQVAGEFQQFQVIVQRFIENESFQGPRLPNYVKNRCVLRNLLQVPVIKEDCWKDKMEEQRKGNDAITSEMLEDIMEESIRVFWEFVKADKDETPVILKGLLATHVELQDPSDHELMDDAREILLKKEKKLKDILRTGNCLVRKFKKPQEDRSNQDLFFSQVDLKLVARVLKMSRITTDQLVWCHKKLEKISFVDRKIQREPSFFLFPV